MFFSVTSNTECIIFLQRIKPFCLYPCCPHVSWFPSTVKRHEGAMSWKTLNCLLNVTVCMSVWKASDTLFTPEIKKSIYNIDILMINIRWFSLFFNISGLWTIYLARQAMCRHWKKFSLWHFSLFSDIVENKKQFVDDENNCWIRLQHVWTLNMHNTPLKSRKVCTCTTHEY